MNSSLILRFSCVLLCGLLHASAAATDLDPGQMTWSFDEAGTQRIREPPAHLERVDVYLVYRPNGMGIQRIRAALQIPSSLDHMLLGWEVNASFDDLDPAFDRLDLAVKDGGCIDSKESLVLFRLQYENWNYFDDEGAFEVHEPDWLGGPYPLSVETCSSSAQIPIRLTPFLCEEFEQDEPTDGSAVMTAWFACLIGASTYMPMVSPQVASGDPGSITSLPLILNSKNVQAGKMGADYWYGYPLVELRCRLRWDPARADFHGVQPSGEARDWQIDYELVSPGELQLHLQAPDDAHALTTDVRLAMLHLGLSEEESVSQVIVDQVVGVTLEGYETYGTWYREINQIWSGAHKVDPHRPQQVTLADAVRVHQLLDAERLLTFSELGWADFDLNLGLDLRDVRGFLRASMTEGQRWLPVTFNKRAHAVEFDVSASAGFFFAMQCSQDRADEISVESDHGVIELVQKADDLFHVSLSDDAIRAHQVTLQIPDDMTISNLRLIALRGVDLDGNPMSMSHDFAGPTDSPPATAAAGWLDVSPNPFNPRSKLRFELAHAARVGIEIFDVRGRLVRSEADVRYEAGVHTRLLDGRGMASGVYVLRLLVDGRSVDEIRATLVR